MDTPPRLARAAVRVPAGRWGVGVSGGTDSVALVRLLHAVTGRRWVVLHVDHAARDASAADADFVRDLAATLDLPFHGVRLTPVRPTEAAWRASRFDAFRAMCRDADAQGVVLAHHADDLAETVAIRLLRGDAASGVRGLSPMRRSSRVGGLAVVRPLLGVRRVWLREYLRNLGQPWRHDPTNDTPNFLRNRVRAVLDGDDTLVRTLLRLQEAARRHARRLVATSEALAELAVLDEADPILLEATRCWLTERGVTRLDHAAVRRAAACAAGTGQRVVTLPGGVRLRRLGRRHGGGLLLLPRRPTVTPPVRSSPSGDGS